MDNVDNYIECPYNKSHQILSSRMQYHLVKCQKNYPLTEKETCPFDATHRVPKPEFKYHIAHCPNRKVLESHKYQLESEADHGDLGLAPYHHPDLPPPEENWDNDPPVPAYQPNLSANQPLFRSLAGATKSKRKEFRLQERLRAQGLEVKRSDEEGNASNEIDNTAPLRRPKRSSQALQALKMNPSMGLGRGSIPSNDSRASPDNIDDFDVSSGDSHYDLPQDCARLPQDCARLPFGLGRGAIPEHTSL